MFEWMENYIEPFIMVLVAIFFLRMWSATELKKKELEEIGKRERSQINCDAKTAASHNDLLFNLRQMQESSGEDDELTQAMQLLTPFINQNSSQAANAPGQEEMVQQLQAFSQTPEGAEAMTKFNSFKEKNGGMM